jgi:hypothetical protein
VLNTVTDGGSPLGGVERIANLDENLTAKVCRARLTEGGKRVRAIGAVEDHLPKAAASAKVLKAGLVVAGARPTMIRRPIHTFRSDPFPDNGGAEDHAPPGCHLPGAPAECGRTRCRRARRD